MKSPSDQHLGAVEQHVGVFGLLHAWAHSVARSWQIRVHHIGSNLP